VDFDGVLGAGESALLPGASASASRSLTLPYDTNVCGCVNSLVDDILLSYRYRTTARPIHTARPLHTAQSHDRSTSCQQHAVPLYKQYPGRGMEGSRHGVFESVFGAECRRWWETAPKTQILGRRGLHVRALRGHTSRDGLLVAEHNGCNALGLWRTAWHLDMALSRCVLTWAPFTTQYTQGHERGLGRVRARWCIEKRLSMGADGVNVSSSNSSRS
jgi:hypothetical protein